MTSLIFIITTLLYDYQPSNLSNPPSLMGLAPLLLIIYDHKFFSTVLLSGFTDDEPTVVKQVLDMGEEVSHHFTCFVYICTCNIVTVRSKAP